MSTSALPSIDAVVRRSPHAAWVEIGDEVVIYEGPTDQVHKLDAVAALVWQLLDDTTSLAETARELSAAFAAELETVQRDVTALVADLHAKSLVEVRP